MREKFTLEQEEIDNLVRDRYKRIRTEPLREKRIFGIATAKQVGHVPNLQISFTEDEENFNRDTYTFKQLISVDKGSTNVTNENSSIKVDINKEIFK